MSRDAEDLRKAPAGADLRRSIARERLRLALPAAAELLRSRQAALIATDDIDDFVALNWLEWHGGSLRLTVTGSNVCSQLALPRVRRAPDHRRAVP
jgi:hypothetical protein